MDRYQVAERVAQIRAMAGDDEAAHCAEDALYGEVLAAIASDGCTDDVREVAAAALKTQDIEFSRWYA